MLVRLEMISLLFQSNTIKESTPKYGVGYTSNPAYTGVFVLAAQAFNVNKIKMSRFSASFLIYSLFSREYCQVN